MLHNLKHNKVLHEKNVLLTIRIMPRPYVHEDDRITYEPVSDDFKKLLICYGYMDTPNIPKALALAKARAGLKFDIMATSFFIGRRSLRASPRGGMPLWQDNLYILLSRQADDLIEYFRIPPGRVIELGSQVIL
jgi:KUP system potassium uptake protein